MNENKDLMNKNTSPQKPSNDKIKAAVAAVVALAATIDTAVEVHAGCSSGCYGCGSGCTGTCETACGKGCRYGCDATCSGQCSGNCRGNCRGDCSGSCRSGCSGCSGSCTGSCSGQCSGCSGSCSGQCSGCSGSCTGSCSGQCSGCSGACSGSCQGCSGSCSGQCSGCSGSCSGSCNGCSGCGSGCATGCSGCGSGCASGCSGCSGTCSGSCSGSCSGTALGKYTVTFNNQSATTAGTTSVTATVGSAMPSITVPKKTNYEFMGYYTSTNGGGTKYYTSSGSSARTWDISAATTLYAYWKMSACVVTYNPNGGSVSPTSKAINLTTTYGTLPTPTRAGYDFVGWFTAASGGTQIKTTDVVPNQTSYTIYAHWKARTDTAYKVEHYQMKVTGSGYDLIETENLKGTTDTSVTPEVKTYEGFTSPAKQTVNIDGNGSRVVKYYYERNKYKVTIKAGTGVDAQDIVEEYYYGQEVNISRKPKKGYKFKRFRSNKDINAKPKN